MIDFRRVKVPEMTCTQQDGPSAKTQAGPLSPLITSRGGAASTHRSHLFSWFRGRIPQVNFEKARECLVRKFDLPDVDPAIAHAEATAAVRRFESGSFLYGDDSIVCHA
jgi:hypothetical protein